MRNKKKEEARRERATKGVRAAVLYSRAAPSNAYFVCLSSDSPQNLLSSLPCGLVAVSQPTLDHPQPTAYDERSRRSPSFPPSRPFRPACALRPRNSPSISSASLILGTSDGGGVRACALVRARVRVFPSLAVYGGCGSDGEALSNSRYSSAPGLLST